MSAMVTVDTIRVLIADRHLLHRTALRSVLETEESLTVAGDAGDTGETIKQVRWLKPDVLLVDASLLGNDLSVLREVCVQMPSTQVVAMAAKPDDDLLVRVLDAGGKGAVLRSMPLEAMVSAVQAAAAGEYVVPAPLVSDTVSWFLAERQRGAEARAILTRLTPREREVLGLLVAGNGNRAIADELVISPETAKGHIYSVMRKVGAATRVEAAAIAVRYGLVEPREARDAT